MIRDTYACGSCFFLRNPSSNGKLCTDMGIEEKDIPCSRWKPSFSPAMEKIQSTIFTLTHEDLHLLEKILDNKAYAAMDSTLHFLYLQIANMENKEEVKAICHWMVKQAYKYEKVEKLTGYQIGETIYARLQKGDWQKGIITGLTNQYVQGKTPSSKFTLLFSSVRKTGQTVKFLHDNAEKKGVVTDIQGNEAKISIVTKNAFKETIQIALDSTQTI